MKESDIQAATAARFMCSAGSCNYVGICIEQQECQAVLQRTAAQLGYYAPAVSKIEGFVAPICTEAKPTYEYLLSFNGALLEHLAGLEKEFTDRDRRYLDELTEKNKQITKLESDNRASMAALLRKNELIANQEVVIKALTDAVDYLHMKLFFGSDPTPTDLPDPSRRADGTLAPQKPFPVPNQQDPSRRVGG